MKRLVVLVGARLAPPKHVPAPSPCSLQAVALISAANMSFKMGESVVAKSEYQALLEGSAGPLTPHQLGTPRP